MANALLLVVSVYAAIGGLFGLLFAWRGAGQIDAAARRAPWTFRALIVPGAAALWPALARRWRRAVRNGGAA